MSDSAPIVTRRSKVQGRGVFATRDVAEGERIVEYTGGTPGVALGGNFVRGVARAIDRANFVAGGKIGSG